MNFMTRMTGGTYALAHGGGLTGFAVDKGERYIAAAGFGFIKGYYREKSLIGGKVPVDVVVGGAATLASTTATGFKVGQTGTRHTGLVSGYCTIATVAVTASSTGMVSCASATGVVSGDRVFVHHNPTPSTVTNGEFDDQFTWITAGELYGKLIAAGMLP